MFDMNAKVKKKTATAVKTVDLTVKDFQRKMGLGRKTAGYIAATVMLKMLCRRGIAKRYGSVQKDFGRPSIIYRLPVEFTLRAKVRGAESA